MALVLIWSLRSLAAGRTEERRSAHRGAVARRPLVWQKNAWRQSIQHPRTHVLVSFGVVAVAALVLIVWLLPTVLTERPHIRDAADRHKAIADTRTSMITMLAAIGAAGGLAYTARTYRLSREGQLTDRYSKAVEQLGSDHIEVRIGGIYALERLMRDSRADQPPIVETLAAYIRHRASPRWPAPTPAEEGRNSNYSGVPSAMPAQDRPTEDIQAALTVLGRRHPVEGERPVNLEGANLTGARLDKADLAGAYLVRVNLTDARLDEADLSGASLHEANLTLAWLHCADLAHARLPHADLTCADLETADLTGAQLRQANLTGAVLDAANLTGAVLDGANFTDTDLVGTVLTDTSLFRATDPRRPA
jgi:hypothetical protein